MSIVEWVRGADGTALIAAAFVALGAVIAVWLVLTRPREPRTASEALPDRDASFDVKPTPADRRLEAELLRVASVPGKGVGVLARRDLPAWTCLGPYPGKVYTVEQHDALKAKGILDHEYALDFFRAVPGAVVQETDTIDPREHREREVPPEFDYPTLYLNEPDDTRRPNVAWVWNFPRRRVEMWTATDVRRGEELVICYGQGYTRSYKTSCEIPGVEHFRYAIGHPRQTKPVLWYDVVGPENRAPDTVPVSAATAAAASTNDAATNAKK